MTREEAIKIFLNGGWIKVEGGTYFDGDKWREAIMVISDYFRNEYKALEQEPKIGHWIDNMDLGYHVSICSNCDWRGHGDVTLIYKPKYCPNCGAKMEGR